MSAMCGGCVHMPPLFHPAAPSPRSSVSPRKTTLPSSQLGREYEQMALKETVEKKITGMPHGTELLALWERVWSAYENGGSKSVEEVLDALRDEVANEEEK